MTEINFTLQLEDGSLTSLQLPPRGYTLGRHPGSNIVLPSLGASRRHARIKVSEKAVFVEDLGPSRGQHAERLLPCPRQRDLPARRHHRQVHRRLNSGRVRQPRSGSGTPFQGCVRRHRGAAQNSRRQRPQKKAGLPFCDLGMGLDTGEVLHGFIGAEERLEYTVIGDTANKASRYCDGAAAGEILLGPLTAQEVAVLLALERRSIATKHEGDLPAFAVEWRA